MPAFKVVWTTFETTETPEQAAREALRAIQEYNAWLFEVFDEDGKCHKVDLDQVTDGGDE